MRLYVEHQHNRGRGELWFHVAYEQRRLMGCGYVGRVVRLEGQLEVVRGSGESR